MPIHQPPYSKCSSLPISVVDNVFQGFIWTTEQNFAGVAKWGTFGKLRPFLLKWDIGVMNVQDGADIR
jgi:hypothetical protein